MFKSHFSDQRLWAVTRDSISRNRWYEQSPRASFYQKSRIRAYFWHFLRPFLRKSWNSVLPRAKVCLYRFLTRFRRETSRANLFSCKNWTTFVFTTFHASAEISAKKHKETEKAHFFQNKVWPESSKRKVDFVFPGQSILKIVCFLKFLCVFFSQKFPQKREKV